MDKNLRANAVISLALTCVMLVPVMAAYFTQATKIGYLEMRVETLGLQMDEVGEEAPDIDYVNHKGQFGNLRKELKAIRERKEGVPEKKPLQLYDTRKVTAREKIHDMTWWATWMSWDGGTSYYLIADSWHMKVSRNNWIGVSNDDPVKGLWVCNKGSIFDKDK